MMQFRIRERLRSPGRRYIGGLSVSSNSANRPRLEPERDLRSVVTGGGTGGHTYPALTAIRTLQATLAIDRPQIKSPVVGTPNSLESRIAAGADAWTW